MGASSLRNGGAVRNKNSLLDEHFFKTGICSSCVSACTTKLNSRCFVGRKEWGKFLNFQWEQYIGTLYTEHSVSQSVNMLSICMDECVRAPFVLPTKMLATPNCCSCNDNYRNFSVTHSLRNQTNYNLYFFIPVFIWFIIKSKSKIRRMS